MPKVLPEDDLVSLKIHNQATMAGGDTKIFGIMAVPT